MFNLSSSHQGAEPIKKLAQYRHAISQKNVPEPQQTSQSKHPKVHTVMKSMSQSGFQMSVVKPKPK